MIAALDAEDAVMDKMVKEGSRKAIIRFGKAAGKLKHPPTWAATAGGLARELRGRVLACRVKRELGAYPWGAGRGVGLVHGSAVCRASPLPHGCRRVQ